MSANAEMEKAEKRKGAVVARGLEKCAETVETRIRNAIVRLPPLTGENAEQFMLELENLLRHGGCGIGCFRQRH